MKALQNVKVTHAQCSLFGRTGRIMTVNSTMATVDFGDGVAQAMFKWQIEPTTRYTDMTKKQPISKRQMIQNKHDECKGVNTYTALVMSKFCEELLNKNSIK